MATQKLTVGSTTWVNLVTELSLVVGTAYTLQNVSPSGARLAEKATAPTDDNISHGLGSGKDITIVPETGLGLWIKARLEGNSCTVVLTEAA